MALKLEVNLFIKMIFQYVIACHDVSFFRDKFTKNMPGNKFMYSLASSYRGYLKGLL